MAETIEQFVKDRGIDCLMHFTRASNLPTIIERGLVTRDTLLLEGKQDLCNDKLRIDNTYAVCASIGFPNYKMFWGLRQDNPNVEWVVLALDPKVLWETACAFCVANAASAAVTAIPLEQRMTLQAFKAMFADFGEKQRGSLALPDGCPTNPQAEVLLLEGAPRKYIGGAWVLNTAQKAKLEAQHPGFPLVANASVFGPRKDFAHWK